MVEINVSESNSPIPVGKFEFLVVPQQGDQFAIPWKDDPYGVRWFKVDEVIHYASGVKMNDVDTTPSIELKTTEIL